LKEGKEKEFINKRERVSKVQNRECYYQNARVKTDKTKVLNRKEAEERGKPFQRTIESKMFR